VDEPAEVASSQVSPRGDRRARWVPAVIVLAVMLAGGAWWWKGREPPVSSANAGVGAARGAPVVAVPIERADLTLRRRYPGEAFADAVDVSSRISGHVLAIDVRIGDEVKKDQVLARIDDSVIARQIRETKAMQQGARAAAKTAKVASDAADRDLKRAEGLGSKGAISAQELDALRDALRLRQSELVEGSARADEASARLAILQEDLSDVEIRAPFAGVIARRDVDTGAFVQTGAPIVRLVAEDPLRVRFRVPEYETADVAIGQTLRLSSRAPSEIDPVGEIARWSGEVSPIDRTLEVEGVVTTRGALRPGMYVDVVIELGELRGALVVPDAAVVERIDGNGHAHLGVFTVEGDSAHWVDVKTRGRDAGKVALEAALPDDARVLVRGHRDLADGAPIRIVEGSEEAL
jgi:RND family efflux transporter MFP subunit